jgi:F0F1-type ATP synthase membrane subunit a
MMVKDKKTAFVIFVVIFTALWNLLDFLYSTLITKSGYQFKSTTDLMIPLGLALVLGYLQFLRNE